MFEIPSRPLSAPPRPLPLAAALATALLLAPPARADDVGEGGDHRHDTPVELDAIEVDASPLRQRLDAVARPVGVLAGEELDASRAGSIGETVARLPGLQSSFFGAGVGRPVIRGQDGARVQVLNGGTGALDASTISADHAVAIEPFLADRIEVLKGPASLLFGSAAIGGAVNVVDGRVPTAPLGLSVGGRAEVRYGSGAGLGVGALRLDGDAGALSWHVDGFRRSAGDVGIPGHALSPGRIAEELAEGEDPDHFTHGRLPNSRLASDGGAVGASWFGERAWAGAAVSTYRSDYGIPPGAHSHDPDDDDDHDAGHDEHDHEAHAVRIDLRQQRLDLRGGVREAGPLQEFAWRLSRGDYRHNEIEDGVVGTRFEARGTELRLEAVQQPIAGWRGAFGLQAGERDFAAIGDEAFVPASSSRDLGLFVMQERDFGRFKLEVGGRHEHVRIDPDGALPALDRHAGSLALGGLWKFSDAVHLGLNLDRAERAPAAEELYAAGAHVATGSWERGDPGLRNEIARSAELSLHLHGPRHEATIAVYRTQFDDFIHLRDGGREIDGLPERLWAQADARFAGWEAEARFELADVASGLWELRVFADGVRARLANGERLPRIAPGRVGADLEWRRGPWRARLGALRVHAQDEVAPGESPTPGYTLIDTGAAWHHDVGDLGWEVFVEARNLGNADARVHTSFLKDYAPLPGRNVEIGVRVLF
ncbi:TonB-dependent receptor [Arenimonas composti]|uniref:TonB-dependent receptor n=1 Tax=Arenimonas composti TR7-09 = DSM 18010 TaxID=1121013 RepID=A0A091BCR1_9GAMM|nr:TonB-dependent receptor [Arenimonas composti]KFN48614.1 hypothetical protein P873_14035 [Arenimonas composti TR7-09 = DSM 18010]